MNKLLAKDPGERYASMADVQAALEAFHTQDGTGARRRTAPIIAPEPVTGGGRNSGLMPMPSRSAGTPVPGSLQSFTDAPTALQAVTLTKTPTAKRSHALYALAGLGVVVGVLGLVIGLRGGKDKIAVAPPVPQPPPVPAVAPPVPSPPQKVAVELAADAPNAHVVFRRRVANAPAQMQLSATDVVELVEFSAPGYKTQRYWLTFDRPTHLKAHLVKGNGSREATEEETLVALGEVAAPPTTPAVAAAAPQVASADKTVARIPAPVVTKPDAPTMAPRKIGRAAATPEPAKVAATDPAPLVPPVADPAPVPAPQPPPAADPPAPAPVAVAKTEPADASPLPAIDNATVSSVIGTHRPEVLKCFGEGKKHDHAMKGTLTLQLQVDPTGKVKHIQVQSTLNNPLVAACVVRSANAWQFPARGGADLATVNYPFTIN
jgi:hypothetical protein